MKKLDDKTEEDEISKLNNNEDSADINVHPDPESENSIVNETELVKPSINALAQDTMTNNDKLATDEQTISQPTVEKNELNSQNILSSNSSIAGQNNMSTQTDMRQYSDKSIQNTVNAVDASSQTSTDSSTIHNISNSPKFQPYKCQKCNRAYTTRYSLKRHYLKSHESSNNEKTSNVQPSTSNSTESHSNLTENLDLNPCKYVCNFCGSGFLKLTSLNRHKKIFHLSNSILGKRSKSSKQISPKNIKFNKGEKRKSEVQLGNYAKRKRNVSNNFEDWL